MINSKQFKEMSANTCVLLFVIGCVYILAQAMVEARDKNKKREELRENLLEECRADKPEYECRYILSNTHINVE